MNLKVEGVFKPTHYNDTSTDEENEKASILPQINKQSSALQFETKFVLNTMGHPLKKKDDNKKLASTMLKPNFSNQPMQKNPSHSLSNQLVDSTEGLCKYLSASNREILKVNIFTKNSIDICCELQSLVF